MSEISRRILLAGAASAPLLAQQAARTTAAPAPGRDTVPKRHLLSGRCTAESLQKSLTDHARWKPYPTAAEREAWSGLAKDAREMVVKEGEAFLGKPYEPLPATLFLEYARNGNRSRWEGVQFGRRTHLRHTVLAECVEGKGRFLDDIADGIWAICEETFWGVPAHMGAQKRGVGLPDVQEPIIELFSAETGALLAWTHYLFGKQIDQVHSLIRERLEGEIERRLLSVYRNRQDFGWMGLNNDRPVNNWNPWIHSNLLTCALLMDTDPARRAQTVYQILTSLDRFLDSYHEDGGCDEGPGYWNRAGASLFECLDLLQSASNGRVNYFDLPLVRQIGAYIYKVHIAGDWYVNFADAPAKVKPDGSLLYRYGKATGDGDLQALGAYQYQRSGAGLESLGRALPALFQGAEIRKAEARDPLVREAWLDGIQVATARRRAGTTEGFYFAALGGHNAESHNHNDVGNFVVYLNGNPVLIDVGVENYTAKTFSSKRYEIWTMQSAFHNLPTINCVMQAAGRQYEAREVGFHADEAGAEFSADLAAAYPESAGVEKWRRSVRLDRAANGVVVTDRFALRGVGGKIEMSLMTPCTVRADGARAVVLSGGMLGKASVRVAVTAAAAPEFRTEEIAIDDSRLRGSWGNRLYRTVVGWSGLPVTGELRFEITQV
jgi:Heparinase II/III-like protein